MTILVDINVKQAYKRFGTVLKRTADALGSTSPRPTQTSRGRKIIVEACL